MLGSDLLVTLGIIFLVALFGSFVRSSVTDRCLKDFDEFQITVEKKNGRIIWGILHLESTGMELEYTSNVADTAHIETSYLLYKDEYKDLQAIYRYADELTPSGVRRRETGRGGEAARQAERDDDAPCERCAAQSSLTTSTSRHGASPC